jgi:hypothetical protein
MIDKSDTDHDMTCRRLIWVIVLFITGCLLSTVTKAQQTNTLTAREEANGWKSLFNGKNLNGWHSYLEKNPGAAWSVKDNAIMLKKSADSQSKDYADLVTDQEYKNFDLKLEWKMKPCVDSGVIFYVHESPKYKQTYETGPELQIADLACTEPDSRVLKERAGAIFALIPVDTVWVKRAGNWNHYEIIANKGHLKCFVNGHKVIDTYLWDDDWRKLISKSKFKNMPRFGTFRKGHISLQGTEDKGEPGIKIWFRNIKIKRLYKSH